MKNSLLLAAVCAAATLLLLPACSSDESTQSSQSSSANRSATVRKKEKESDDRDNDDKAKRPPRLGMTKAQVRERYGDPSHVSSTPRGETWAYSFGNFEGSDFIPFYGGVHAAFRKRQHCSVVFDASGRVKDYTWGVTDPGASAFR